MPENKEGAAQTAEDLAQKFHETYERLALDFGYETRKESAKPWSEVPEKNKRLMIAVCTDLLKDAASHFSRSEQKQATELLAKETARAITEVRVDEWFESSLNRLDEIIVEEINLRFKNWEQVAPAEREILQCALDWNEEYKSLNHLVGNPHWVNLAKESLGMEGHYVKLERGASEVLCPAPNITWSGDSEAFYALPNCPECSGTGKIVSIKGVPSPEPTPLIQGDSDEGDSGIGLAGFDEPESLVPSEDTRECKECSANDRDWKQIADELGCEPFREDMLRKIRLLQAVS